MRINRILTIFIIISVLLGMTGWTASIAQEDEYTLAHGDVFGKLRRPNVYFSHEIHSESLSDTGCGVCHHVRDDKTGQLVYAEGDELSCKECHVSQKENGKPALREAYHGSCTVCHRSRIKSNESKSGPTTCGGCHQKT
jgi:hypothetical protein